MLPGASLVLAKPLRVSERAGGNHLSGGAARGQGWHKALGCGAGPSLLGVGFLQQAGPKLLVVAAGMHKEVLAVQDRQAIVHHHFHPLATLPELEESSIYGSVEVGQKGAPGPSAWARR